jgi:hypothetical protein
MTVEQENIAQSNLDLALANDPRSATPLQASEAFLELTSMFSHRGDGIPTQYVHSPKVADAAQVLWLALITALRDREQARAEAIEPLVGAIDAAMTDLDLLRRAIEDRDPWAELLIRTTDTWRRLDSAIRSLSAAQEG